MDCYFKESVALEIIGDPEQCRKGLELLEPCIMKKKISSVVILF